MQFIDGAPNNLQIKAIKKSDDGKLTVTICLDNQEEDFNLFDILSEEDYSLVNNNLKTTFGIFLPQLINKLLTQ